ISMHTCTEYVCTTHKPPYPTHLLYLLTYVSTYVLRTYKWPCRVVLSLPFPAIGRVRFSAKIQLSSHPDTRQPTSIRQIPYLGLFFSFSLNLLMCAPNTQSNPRTLDLGVPFLLSSFSY